MTVAGGGPSARPPSDTGASPAAPPATAGEGRPAGLLPQPELRTARLHLRPFRPEDAAEVRRLAGAREVAMNTATIPHPYEEGMAEAWIGGLSLEREAGGGLVYAITLAAERRLVGAMGLRIEAEHARAELGYWIGVPYWGNGYATEAAGAVLDHGFGALGLERIEAHHLMRNPASGRVLEKIGMREEGISRRHIRKWGEFHDIRRLAVLRDEHAARRGAAARGESR